MSVHVFVCVWKYSICMVCTACVLLCLPDSDCLRFFVFPQRHECLHLISSQVRVMLWLCLGRIHITGCRHHHLPYAGEFISYEHRRVSTEEVVQRTYALFEFQGSSKAEWRLKIEEKNKNELTNIWMGEGAQKQSVDAYKRESRSAKETWHEIRTNDIKHTTWDDTIWGTMTQDRMTVKEEGWDDVR